MVFWIMRQRVRRNQGVDRFASRPHGPPACAAARPAVTI